MALNVRARSATSSRPSTSIRRDRSVSPMARAVSVTWRIGRRIRPAAIQPTTAASSTMAAATASAVLMASAISSRSAATKLATAKTPSVLPASSCSGIASHRTGPSSVASSPRPGCVRPAQRPPASGRSSSATGAGERAWKFPATNVKKASPSSGTFRRRKVSKMAATSLPNGRPVAGSLPAASWLISSIS